MVILITTPNKLFPFAKIVTTTQIPQASPIIIAHHKTVRLMKSIVMENVKLLSALDTYQDQCKMKTLADRTPLVLAHLAKRQSPLVNVFLVPSLQLSSMINVSLAPRDNDLTIQPNSASL
jgi:hypothetical protein